MSDPKEESPPDFRFRALGLPLIPDAIGLRAHYMSTYEATRPLPALTEGA